jgi:hypothetical protein
MKKNLPDAYCVPDPSAVPVGTALWKSLVGRAADLKEQRAIFVIVIVRGYEWAAIGAILVCRKRRL